MKNYQKKLNINSSKFYFLFNLILFNVIFIIIFEKTGKNEDINLIRFINTKDYNNIKFAIITRKCRLCGLFSFYIVYLGCIHKYLLEGYIPIIDIKSFPNVINGFNITKNNHWELFFEQPFGYTLEEILKKGKNIIHITDCNCGPRPDEKSMLINWPKKNFWHNFANKYSPIKKEIILISNNIIQKLFKQSKNILGVLARGTDYISLKPKGHSIPPNVSVLINDIKEMDNKYKYDYIFFSTEDDIIRRNITKYFKNKLKELKPKTNIKYNYLKKEPLNLNENINGNIEFNKIYLINIIILSKCLDIITARCSGTSGLFILSNGFRNIKIYDLGYY